MTMAEIADWASTNPMYAIGTVVGFALGIFYGFDGWRGSTEDVELKDSPRVKNLLWVAGGAFSAIIGEVKAIDPSAKKPVVLLAYFVSFLTGAVIVVVSWGIIVLIDMVRSPERLRRAYSALDAAGDYFYFGYRKYRSRKDEVSARQLRSFVEDYLEQLTYSITIAGSRIRSEQRVSVARDVLRTMAAVVRKYRGENSDAQIRTNLMLVRDCTTDLKAKLHFLLDEQEVEKCLELVIYDDGEMRHDLVLPLPKSGDIKDALPGAPSAFLGETPVIVDDTNHIEISNSFTHKVKDAMQEYFASKDARFKSFASLKVVGAGKAIAVVNIECVDKHVFGTEEEDKVELVAYLFPFCSTLGILLSES